MNSPTSKKVAASCWMLAFVIGAFGVWIMLSAGVSWKAIAGLALILWGNNLSQVRP
jgi:hypothetical protein